MQQRWLRAYANWITRHSTLVVVFAFLLAAVSVVSSVFFLKTKTGILDLYSEKNPAAARFLQYTKEFGAAETLIIVFEGGTEKDRQQAMEALAARLRADPQHLIEDIFYKINLKLFTEHAFQFLSEGQAKELLAQVKSPEGGIRNLFETQDLTGFFSYLNVQVEKGLKKGGSVTPESARDLAKLIAPLKMFRDALEGETFSKEAIANRFESTEDKSAVLDDEGYLRTDDKKMHVMMIRPVDRRQDYHSAMVMVKWTRQQIEPVKAQFPNLTVGVTGGPALNSDQFSISKKDMTLASLFAYFSTAVIFILAFRAFARPLLGLLTLSLSLCTVFGLVTLSIGHLNLFSMAFIVILVGQGTYYGVHVVARYEEELVKGCSVAQAISETLCHIFGNVTTSALTTAAAFFVTILVPLEGFAELGWIAGSGVLLSCLFMLSVLPAFLNLYDRHRPKEKLLQAGKKLRATMSDRTIERLRQIMIKRAGWVIIGILSLALWGAYRFYSPLHGVAFDNNLLNLQAKDTEAVRYEKKLIDTSLSPRAGIFMTRNLDTARSWVGKARASSTVQRVEWLGDVFPEGTIQGSMHQSLRQSILKLSDTPLRAPDPSALQTELLRLKKNLEAIQNMALSASGGDQVIAESETGISTIDAILGKLPAPQSVENFQSDFFSAIRGMLTEAAKSPALTLAQIPKELRDRFISSDGLYAIYAYPKINIWDRDKLEEFVAQLTAISPQATGPPMMFYEILSQVRSSYFKAAGFSALAIFLIFLLDFRSLRYSLLAFWPLVLGVFMLLGLMSVLDLTFNTANMIALPMILGIGADNGVHMIHRFREEGQTNIDFIFKSTGKALLVTYLDSMTSFLGLAFASHQGLASLGQVVILGLTCCSIAGILFLPAVMTLIVRVKKRNLATQS